MSAANLEFSAKYFGNSAQEKVWSFGMRRIRECTVANCGFAFLWESALSIKLAQ